MKHGFAKRALALGASAATTLLLFSGVVSLGHSDRAAVLAAKMSPKIIAATPENTVKR